MMKWYLVLGLVCLSVLVRSDEEKEDKKEADLGTVIGIDLGTTYSW